MRRTRRPDNCPASTSTSPRVTDPSPYSAHTDGGCTPSSSRSCPELPPLSNIVTTAFTFSHGLFFSPPSRLGRPVPPPKQPTLNCRKRMWITFYTMSFMSPADAVKTLERDLQKI